jgi:hypothetical protein
MCLEGVLRDQERSPDAGQSRHPDRGSSYTPTLAGARPAAPAEHEDEQCSDQREDQQRPQL